MRKTGGSLPLVGALGSILESPAPTELTPRKPPPSLGSVSVQQKVCTEADDLEGPSEGQSL